MNTTTWETKVGYEEAYREGYDTAGNYHIYGVYSGHTVVKSVDMGFEQEGNCNDGCYACWKKYL